MEQTNTVESAGVKDAILEALAGELGPQVFRRFAVAAFSSEKTLEELKAVLLDWEGFSKSLPSKGGAGVLQGYALVATGRLDEAEEVLKAQKRQEWGAYYLARSFLARDRVAEALEVAEEGYEKFSASLPLAYLVVEARARSGKVEEARKLLDKLKKAQGESAEYRYALGVLNEKLGEYHTALEGYRETVARDPGHAEALFRLGYLLDLYGEEADEANEEAINAYEACVKIPPIHTNAVINLGILYEDRERYHDAIKCYETVLDHFPNHERARLYLTDAYAATRMFYDKDQEKKADRHSQVLKIPVSDFELSVRSRNCLQKMNIGTLGDLIMKTEQELLSYKNFGETSLAEIKEMLNQKSLRLGQGLENRGGDLSGGRNPLEATADPETLDKPIEELELSVRSRRCMDRLEVRTVRDLINKTEVELMAAKNFGMTSLNEIKRKLADLGLSLRS